MEVKLFFFGRIANEVSTLKGEPGMRHYCCDMDVDTECCNKRIHDLTEWLKIEIFLPLEVVVRLEGQQWNSCLHQEPAATSTTWL
jgi:hypothetical protein